MEDDVIFHAMLTSASDVDKCLFSSSEVFADPVPVSRDRVVLNSSLVGAWYSNCFYSFHVGRLRTHVTKIRVPEFVRVATASSQGLLCAVTVSKPASTSESPDHNLVTS